MRQVVRSIRALAAAGAALLLACGGSSPAPAHPTLVITGLDWIEENIDPSFWTTSPPGGGTAFYDFWIHYAGEVSLSDIQYARVYLPNGAYWTITGEASRFDAANQTIGGYGHWYDHLSPGVLPVGPLQVEVKLNDGVDAIYTATVPPPGSATAGTFTTMHTEDVALTPASSAPMVRRASLGAATVDVAARTIRIDFSVDDPSVYDGWVWLYNGANTYLGASSFFRDPVTGLVNAPLGGVLATDGTPNTLTLQAADLSLGEGVTFDQIARARVVLSDGAQYQQPTTGRLQLACRSVSAVAALAAQ